MKTWSTWNQVQISAITIHARQGCWARWVASVTEHPRPSTAVSWCAAAVASRHRRWRWWTGAAVSSTGAVTLNANSAVKWWRFTRAGDGGGGTEGTADRQKMPRTPDRLKKRGSREDLFSSFISFNHPSLLLLFNRHRLIAREVKGHLILYFFLPP